MLTINKLEAIKILGDTYLLRKTFDIIDDRGGSYGYDIFDNNKRFLKHYDTENKNDVILGINLDIYRISL